VAQLHQVPGTVEHDQLGAGDLRGKLAVAPGEDGSAYERTGYVRALRAANAGTYGPW